MDLAPVLREPRRHLLGDEDPGQIGDLQATVDPVVIGDGDEVHPAFRSSAWSLRGSV